MIQVDLKELIAKLNAPARRSLEAAAGLCLSRTNYNVEIEHWLMKLSEQPHTDATEIVRHFQLDVSRLSADLTRGLDRLKTGNVRPPALSPDLVALIRSAWLIASVDHGAGSIRTGHLLCALLADESLRHVARGASPQIEKISVEALRTNLAVITRDSEESEEAVSAPSPAAPGAVSGRPQGPTKTPALDQYTIDLTQRAREGKIDPVLGRDSEIRQIVDILLRRRQNNPILTGEAGVGKTAVVEGFALRLASGDVPAPLKNVVLRALDLGLLQAGAGVKGEFENRLKSVINEVKSSAVPVILFIDEAHTLIGAGGTTGQNDAANLLKPALARGELRTIAATTWAEYKRYFEKDAAMARRFQVVKVEEPTEEQAVQMMRGLAETLETHHRVRILNEAVVDAVKLSNRYISGRQLPDKAVSLLDTTCARIALSQSATPPSLEDVSRQIEQLEVTMAVLRREEITGVQHDEQLAELRTRRDAAEADRARLIERWELEKELVKRVNALRSQLESRIAAPPSQEQASHKGQTQPSAAETDPAGHPAAPTAAELTAQLAAANQELRELQGEDALVHPSVNSQAVAQTVAAWTGIPVGRMVADEIRTVLNLKQTMEQKIIGQSHALERIAQSIRTSRANLRDPRAPIGVFLLAGTSGVGKTETAITLAELLYGGEQNMTVINMSEFKEEHKVSLLMGSPPGYVGYGEGGILTEAVRRKPYSVVLLDEMEKAHSGVQDIFYQVFDKGTMKDGEGRDIDFKNAVILMTTNAGTELIKGLCADADTSPAPDAFVEAIFPELLKTFKPAFLGRVTIIPYYPLSDDTLKTIIKLKLNKIAQRVREHYRAEFTYTPDLISTIAARCTEVDTGARNVDHILTRTLLPELSARFLARMADAQAIQRVTISVGRLGDFDYTVG